MGAFASYIQASVSVLLQSVVFGIAGRFKDPKKAATAVEYGIMVAAIAAVIITVVFTIGERVLKAFTTVQDELPA
ncbi:Flp family type IVb pilin [Propionibacteriaceae bacterium G57]|uniref:Flp family type IVb pilin n=1 Tax=Aestuariimicrobium sp. G57 TaxID=3418485 RepID=UPI003DA6D248